MKKGLIHAVSVVCFVWPSEANGQELSEPDKYFDRPSFYADAEPGTIAFLPDSNQEGYAEYMTSFWGMPRDKCYELPKRKNYGFVANIRDNTRQRTTPSFLAVTILQIQDSTSSAGAWVELTRNQNWIRDGDSEFRPEPREFQNPQITFDDLRLWQSDLTSMSAFDLALRGKSNLKFSWHAKPKESVTSSWDFRNELFGPASNKNIALKDLISNWFPDIQKDYKLRVATHLLRFTPVWGRVPKEPMDFYFNNCGAKRAVIITKCPDYPNYSSLVLLKFK